MKRLSILLFFIAIMMPPCHEPGTSMAQDATECLDTFPQQCVESVQLARLTLPMVGGSVPVVAGCTSPSGNHFAESFESCAANGTSCDETWANTGSGMTYNESTPGTPLDNTACAKSYKLVGTGTSYYYGQMNSGSLIDLDSGDGYQIVLYIYLESFSLASGQYTSIMEACANAGGSNCGTNLVLKNNSGTYQFQVRGTSIGTAATGTWYKITFMIGVSSSWAQLDSGSQTAYTRVAAKDFQYLLFENLGSNAENAVTYFVGSVVGDTL